MITGTGKLAIVRVNDQGRTGTRPPGLATGIAMSVTWNVKNTASFLVRLVTENCHKGGQFCAIYCGLASGYSTDYIPIVSSVTTCRRALLCCIVFTASSLTVAAPQTAEQPF